MLFLWENILVQINPDLEAMYLFLSFITLYSKFHSGSKSKRKRERESERQRDRETEKDREEKEIHKYDSICK